MSLLLEWEIKKLFNILIEKLHTHHCDPTFSDIASHTGAEKFETKW